MQSSQLKRKIPSKCYDFKLDLETTKKLEAEFRKSIGSPEPNNNTYDASHENICLELKFDHIIANTNNLFLEIHSSYNPNKYGGVIRAAQDEIPFFIYIDVIKNYSYVFDSNILANFQIENWNNYEVKDVQNIGYLTYGHIIPLNHVIDLCICVCKLSKRSEIGPMIYRIEEYFINVLGGSI